MAKFYELHMAARLPPSTALHRAQAWLRGATRDDIKSFAKAAVKRGHLEGNYVAQVEQALDAEKGKAASKGSTQPAQPYAHPYYWAGFTYTGI
jgi:CHAT domain-containing protein